MALPVTALPATKGDLPVASGSSIRVLPVGTDGQVLTADSGESLGVKWADASGGSGTQSKWAPWVPPASPHAMNDEFDDSSLSGSWTEWDASGLNLLTVAEDSYGLKLTHTDHPTSGENIAGIFRALGADDEYELVTHVALAIPFGNTTQAGIALLENPSGAPTTSDALCLMIRATNVGMTNIAVYRFSDYKTFAFSTPGTVDQKSLSAYLCFQWKASTGKYSAYFSFDGVGWLRIVADTAHGMAAAPGYVGLVANTELTMIARYEFFRVRSGASGIYNVMPTPLGG